MQQTLNSFKQLLVAIKFRTFNSRLTSLPLSRRCPLCRQRGDHRTGVTGQLRHADHRQLHLLRGHLLLHRRTADLIPDAEAADQDERQDERADDVLAAVPEVSLTEKLSCVTCDARPRCSLIIFNFFGLKLSCLVYAIAAGKPVCHD